MEEEVEFEIFSQCMEQRGVGMSLSYRIGERDTACRRFCWWSARSYTSSSALSLVSTTVGQPQLSYIYMSLDCKPLVQKAQRKRRQQQCDTQIENKLYTAKPKIGSYVYTEKQDRTTEVNMGRLRIGHTNATHSRLLNCAPPPRCDRCGHRLSVMYALVEWPHFQSARICTR